MPAKIKGVLQPEPVLASVTDKPEGQSPIPSEFRPDGRGCAYPWSLLLNGNPSKVRSASKNQRSHTRCDPQPSGEALFLSLIILSFVLAGPPAEAGNKQPNILIIWGDDIGYWNVSAYNQGMMGYKTPNIDRIAKEGALFTDWYGQQSCTAGRAAFITGQVGFRTGLLKVGLPGAKEGLQERDVTLAQLLKGQGYMTAQFGKNHLGDRDEHLPTAHGFDEFMGSLYHLNAEEEPENVDYFKDPEMIKKYNTRGVIHTWANPDGTQKIESTGPLTKKRMETIDEEVTKVSLDLPRAREEGKQAVLPLVELHPNAHLHAPQEGKRR